MPAAALLAFLAALWSCSMFPDVREAWSPPSRLPSAPAPPPPAAGAELSVTARPAYRLAISPGGADAPSRLLVLQVRLATSDDSALSVAPEDIVLTLPNGEPGRVFDQARAVEVLHRAILADADLSYLQSGSAHPPGGIDDGTRSGLVDIILGNLLSAQAFAGGQGAQGFVVVDTQVPLTSLAGASLQVVAYRLRDTSPVTAPYQFNAAPAAATPAS